MSWNSILEPLILPWQFDKDVTYNGRKNTYSFMLNGKKVNLLPLSSQQVRED